MLIEFSLTLISSLFGFVWMPSADVRSL
jgi:hypothetical protein